MHAGIHGSNATPSAFSATMHGMHWLGGSTMEHDDSHRNALAWARTPMVLGRSVQVPVLDSW